MRKQIFFYQHRLPGLFFSCLLIIFSGHVFAYGCASSAAIEQVADGVYVRQGTHGMPFVDRNIANIGFIAGRDCVAVIDSGGDPAEGRMLDCAVKKTTPVPVCYVIITHHHFDHALGSLAFREENTDRPEFIGHEKLPQALQVNTDYYLTQLGQEQNKALIVMPDRTVAAGETLELDLGGRILQISAHPPAHTSNDLSIFDLQTGTLWLSDLLFLERIPALEGSARGWLETMTALQRQAAAQAIPGHGPVKAPWPAAGNDLVRYFTRLRDEIRILLDAGGSLEEAQNTAGYAEKDKWLMFDENHKRNIIRVYTELEWEE